MAPPDSRQVIDMLARLVADRRIDAAQAAADVAIVPDAARRAGCVGHEEGKVHVSPGVVGPTL